MKNCGELRFWSCLCLFLFASISANAGVPQTLDQQGRIIKTDGTPQSGDQGATFSIYDSATSGVALWTERHTLNLDSAGFYVVTLGAQVPFAGLWDGRTLFLGITLDGETELTPREPLLSVPYAIRAGTVDGVMPIGSISAWHKTLPGVPALSDNWVECNGQTLNDAASPLNGQVIPNLNGEARFLRGGATSGVTQQDAVQDHAHANNVAVNGSGDLSTGLMSADHIHGEAPALRRTEFCTGFTGDGITNGLSGGGGLWGQIASCTANTAGANANHSHAVPSHSHALSGNVQGVINGRSATETRPANMSVVWIMRIK